MIGFLARRRVTLGFLVAAIALVLARPTWRAWTAGLAVAIVGEAIRIWAAGHLEKSREVTTSGPYRWVRHPLYLGSTVVAAGVLIAAQRAIVSVFGVLYLAATFAAAIRSEEAFLRKAFGDRYDRYSRDEVSPVERRFSVERAIQNREYRAVAGLFVGFALLALKVLLPI